MGGKVYLKTDRFEVKLEGITFKAKEFEYLCRMDFLFPGGKVWDRPPVVGVDVMRHPRNPSIVLLLICFGVGCVILRFAAGEPLPSPICRFFSDKRIHFVGFGIPEKQELFPFKELGLKPSKVDVGFLSAKALKNRKCRNSDLPELARKVLGIKKIVGLIDAASNQGHAEMKSAICRLFITSIIGIGLLNGEDYKQDSSPRRGSFLKNLNSLQSFAEGMLKGSKKMEKIESEDNEGSVLVQIGGSDDWQSDGGTAEFEAQIVREWENEECKSSVKKPLKGILKCPSSGLKSCKSVRLEDESSTSTLLRRANSKGHNVSFKC